MGEPIYVIGLFGMLSVVVLVRILWLRIKTKTFAGDGGNSELRTELEKFEGLFTVGTIGVILLTALDAFGGEITSTKWLRPFAGYLLFIALLSEGAGKRTNGIISYWYVIGRGCFVVMAGVTSLYLFYIWTVKAEIW